MFTVHFLWIDGAWLDTRPFPPETASRLGNFRRGIEQGYPFFIEWLTDEEVARYWDENQEELRRVQDVAAQEK